MSLTELSTAIPERLPAQLNFADLGSSFSAVQSKQSVHIQPQSGNTFSPVGIRVIRFAVSGEGYLVPESFRHQARFSVLKGTAGTPASSTAVLPLAPMSCLFERVRVISQGQVLSDESHFDRLQVLVKEWMDHDQCKMLCAESFRIENYDDYGTPNHETIGKDKHRRIMMSFVTTPIFNQKKLIPLR